MSIRSKIKSVRVGLKAGVKATDALLKMVDQLESGAKSIIKAAAEIKEITPEDEQEDTETKQS